MRSGSPRDTLAAKPRLMEPLQFSASSPLCQANGYRIVGCNSSQAMSSPEGRSKFPHASRHLCSCPGTCSRNSPPAFFPGLPRKRSSPLPADFLRGTGQRWCFTRRWSTPKAENFEGRLAHVRGAGHGGPLVSPSAGCHARTHANDLGSAIRHQLSVGQPSGSTKRLPYSRTIFIGPIARLPYLWCPRPLSA